MRKFRVRVIYKYSHEVEVEADNESEAKDKSGELVDDSNRVYDDSWYDSEIIEEIEDED